MAINMPQKQSQNAAAGLGLIGTAVGAAYGNPGAGGAIGSTIGGAADANKPPQIAAVTPKHTENPMARRAQQNSSFQAIQEAQSALAQLPPEQQEYYQGPINQAYAMEAKRRGIA